jgi:hypothetical protein
MDNNLAYAIAMGGAIVILLTISYLPYIVQFIYYMSLQVSKYLVYPQILRRHQFLGPLTLADVLLHLIYIAMNIFCLRFRISSVS